MTDWQTVTTGLRFPWRPVACADGSVIVTEIGRTTRCLADGSTTMDITNVSPVDDVVASVANDHSCTTNICWGGDDSMTACVTLSGTGRLTKRRWRRPEPRSNYAR